MCGREGEASMAMMSRRPTARKVGALGATHRGESIYSGLGTATGLVWPEHGGAMGGLGHGDRAMQS